MSKITSAEISKLASLAKITLSDDELEAFQADMESILGFIQQLQSADVEDLDPTEQVTGLTNVLRQDMIVDQGVSPDGLLRIAPESHEGQFKVKRVIS